MCMCMHMYANVHSDQRLAFNVFFSCYPSILETGSFTGPVLLDLNRMSGQLTSGVYLSLFLQYQDHMLIPLCMTFITWALRL